MEHVGQGGNGSPSTTTASAPGVGTAPMGDHLHFLRPFIPERLVFCIDLCNEMNGIEFSKSRKNTFTRLDLVKHMLKMHAATLRFVHLKHKMNPRHEFAIVCLTDAAIWFQDFTSDVELLAKKVSTLQTQGDFPRFNIAKKVALPQVTMEDLKRGGADYLYRVLFIYSRTTVVPEWIDGREKRTSHNGTHAFLDVFEMADRLLATPVFFFDGLYLHKKPSKENNPQGSLEENSYFSETHQSLRRIYTNFTLLLANPLQRPEQDKFKTTLASSKPVKD
ncbi:uncharacterized protein ACA1_288660 [Acanthamoeba castellanii str. Neff]|uniref:BRISC and BRCA1-A complex member 1 n=1 Tax=Acanthamoeba castellanii (strain ATCC 30010 / Neff) TaxID=1257118 RepID=L8HIY1_ACACF|nr:uncharacterized protein ACA1_288660 [Acanthamoeba castellanii str. Neff]ELR25145.1 hypothetical protein ACA1_288660 [Acanthamoeba castellanii str. Neff]